ncbi:MAG: hypothetical protein QOH71_1707 [Blastocatellia bacterium]|nr:hypothetical protein [Blastocatellia bacterium]
MRTAKLSVFKLGLPGKHIPLKSQVSIILSGDPPQRSCYAKRVNKGKLKRQNSLSIQRGEKAKNGVVPYLGY